MTESQAHYLLIFAGIAAAGMLIQGIAVIVIGLGAAKLLKQTADLAAEAKGKIYPILDNVQDISDKVADISQTVRDLTLDTAPKVRRVTTNLADTSDVYRAKVADVDALLSETTAKARRQSDRVDNIVTDVITRTEEIAHNVTHAIMQPVRQVSGLVGGARAGLEALIHNFTPKQTKTPKPVAFEGESVYTGLEDDYHA